MEDNVETRLPLEAFKALLKIGSDMGFDPSSSVEAEEYFVKLVARFDGSPEVIENWLRVN